MFNNIGRKIKTLAKVIAWIGMASSVISGLVTMIEIVILTKADTVLQGVWFLFLGLILGAIVAAVGCLVAWASVLILYGFGQLVENSDKLVGTGFCATKKRPIKKEPKQETETEFSLSEDDDFYKNVKINSLKHNYEAGRLSKEKYEAEMEKYK